MEEVVRKIKFEKKQSSRSTFLPLEFPLGSALQVDHGEVEVEINGARTKGYLFVASVPGQVLRYCQAFPTKASEAWGEFHERAFQFFGGVFNRVIYDNDSVLMKIIMGKERNQTTFSISLEEHYGFESHFCNIGAGNEKGAVENGVSYCRRRFFLGLPSFKSWASLNELLSSCCLKDINQGVHYKTKERLSDLFALLQTKLMSLPTQKTWRRYIAAKVDKCQLVTVDHHQYSVPERFVRSKVRIGLTPFQTEIFKDGEGIAVHERRYGKGDSLSLDHYLDQLSRKPRAFSYAKACKERKFDSKLLEMRDRLSSKYGSSTANKQFIDLLLLQRRWNQKEVAEGVQKALDLGAIDVSAVETILRQKSLSPNWERQDLQSLMPLSSKSWSFDLSAYRELCQEVAT